MTAKFSAICALLPALMAGACSGSQATEGGDAFATDSVGVVDSIAVAACHGSVKIAGLYPSAGPEALLDSTRTWIAARLSAGANYLSFAAPAAPEDDGEALVRAVADSLLKASASDFVGFEADSIATSYEFDYGFRPLYVSDSLLTYNVGAYGYMGGAHGGFTASSQSFRVSDGMPLTFANSFRSDRRSELLDLIKRELWAQYFSVEASEGTTLADCLLVPVDSVGLPAGAPEFVADGVVVTYQQYEIACYAAGLPGCKLSYESLRGLLTPEVERLVPAATEADGK